MVAAALAAKQSGASRFCMGAAWREPSDEDMASVVEMVKAVRDLGMETCATLGMLNDRQTAPLRDAGLQTTTATWIPRRSFSATSSARAITRTGWTRWNGCAKPECTYAAAASSGWVENLTQRAGFNRKLADLEPYPESVPTSTIWSRSRARRLPTPRISTRWISCVPSPVARITMPAARVRLSRRAIKMSDAIQTLCFLAGANSIFYGEQLLTTGNTRGGTRPCVAGQLGMYPFAENQ